MEASELRIGNLVKIHNTFDQVCKITDTSNNANLASIETNKHGDTRLNNVEFIPLTEEWLSHIQNWESKFLITFCWDSGNTAYDGIYITLNNERIKKIDYVHEAQNWHYLTTGKELEFNE